MKHTPGPWSSSFKTTRTNNIGVYSPGGLLIASIDVHQIAPDEVIARRVANGKLMAAAPEMLSVLQEIMSWEENGQMTWAGRANEAIAKATGEQP